jgi:hypothetical protein
MRVGDGKMSCLKQASALRAPTPKRREPRTDAQQRQCAWFGDLFRHESANLVARIIHVSRLDAGWVDAVKTQHVAFGIDVELPSQCRTRYRIGAFRTDPIAARKPGAAAAATVSIHTPGEERPAAGTVWRVLDLRGVDGRRNLDGYFVDVLAATVVIGRVDVNVTRYVSSKPSALKRSNPSTCSMSSLYVDPWQVPHELPTPPIVIELALAVAAPPMIAADAKRTIRNSLFMPLPGLEFLVGRGEGIYTTARASGAMLLPNSTSVVAPLSFDKGWNNGRLLGCC